MKNSFFKNFSPLGLFLVVTCILIWGSTFVSTKYLLSSLSALEILILRFLAAYIALWIAKPRILPFVSVRREILFILAGLSGITVYQFLENTSLFFTSASNVSIIVSICPLFTAIFSRLFLKEKSLNPFFFVGFFVAIIGVALVTFNGKIQIHFSPKGDLLALAAAISWGFYSLAVSKVNSLKLDPILAIRRIFFWALVFMFLPAMFSGKFDFCAVNFFKSPSSLNNLVDPLIIFNILFLGFGASAFCFVAWNMACERLGTVKATLGIYFNPLVTVILAFFVLGEKITLMGFAGMLLTTAGLVVSNIKSKKN